MMHAASILTNDELEKCKNPYEEVAKMAKGLVEELKEKEYDRGYEKGMEDAWETFKKIELVGCDGGLSKVKLFDIFGPLDIPNILKRNSAKEAKEKIDNYIQKKNEEFHVGDEVTFCDERFIVTRVEEDCNNTLYAIGTDGLLSYFNKANKLTKTGRHFDEVEELFKKMKED